MSDVSVMSIPSVENTTATKEEINKDDFSFFAQFDIMLVRILQKFYGSVINPMSEDISCYNIHQLQQNLSKEGLKITTGGLRKKLNFLVKLGFLERVETYPRIYIPLRKVDGIERIQGKINRLKQIFL
jgi:hypothetical protein